MTGACSLRPPYGNIIDSVLTRLILARALTLPLVVVDRYSRPQRVSSSPV